MQDSQSAQRENAQDFSGGLASDLALACTACAARTPEWSKRVDVLGVCGQRIIASLQEEVCGLQATAFETLDMALHRRDKCKPCTCSSAFIAHSAGCLVTNVAEKGLGSGHI